MAQITITIPDAVVQRVLDAFAYRFGYDSVPDPKPTKAAFAKQALVSQIRAVTHDYEKMVAAQAASDTVAGIDTIT